MKKWFSMLVVCMLLITCVLNAALADQETIDLDTMSLDKLQDLIDRATAEYKEATNLTSEDSKTIEKIFESTFVAMMPEDTTYWYPFWGLNKICRRSMFRVNGDCSVKLPGASSKTAYDGLTLLLWKDEDGEFKTAAFFDNDEVFQLDPEMLQNILSNMLSADIERLGAGDGNIAEVTAAPTATPEPGLADISENDTLLEAETDAPTATPEIGLADMSADDALLKAATDAQTSIITTDDVLMLEGQASVYATIGSAWDEKDAVRKACLYAMSISEPLFANQAIDQLVLFFSTELRDKYGNVNNNQVIWMNMSRETAEKINYEWMRTQINQSTLSFFQILDDYTVHSALNKGLY